MSNASGRNGPYTNGSLPQINRSSAEEDALADQTNNLHLGPSHQTTFPGANPNSSAPPPRNISLNRSTWLTATPDQSKWKHAMEEARHFAGGLVTHPHESTKHFTILRHSHGLVFYKGPSTSLAITIFSDQPLPADRRLWLQLKGWTGKAGMKVKGLFRTNGNWINVTPTNRATPSALPPTDERAWQRDIKRFLEKAPKEARTHKIRETDVLRIPAEAEDGYYRIVMTCGNDRSVLCPSPVFRLASTSTSASSVKGSSLATLPVEVGINVLSSMAKGAAGNAISPITSQAAQYAPPSWATQTASVAYDASAMSNKIDAANEQYDTRRDDAVKQALSCPYNEITRACVVGEENGPQSPYPLKLESGIVRGTGRGAAELGFPTANLGIRPESLYIRLSGVYFGWGLIKSRDKKDFLEGWKQAIISVAQCPYNGPDVVPRQVIKVHLIDDFQGHQFFDAKLSLIIMGFLRPFISYDRIEAFLHETHRDIAITHRSLERPAWTPEATINQINHSQSSRSATDRYVDFRQNSQKLMDAVPLHKAGVRTGGASYKDQMVGRGGLYILR
ncbi:hypothetical protein L228DRAFT_153752 [Xylona heveae TC161]|uniref:Riboflavin kinase n=1 Tax=Xylona heveae (strain CBS 132557 / TC161) TaxID=1328760 RepID=A0A165FWB5_XYLHT|nr:hypothetical protein L228DRAFT_153752 [Xylona heveae TC161]KZF21459.1 hypothetical protein L228DRAFT_153752 [Xylona heveae TC161]